MEEFKTGEVVRLKSGSPDMTITANLGSGRVALTCYNEATCAFVTIEVSSLALVKAE